MRILLTGHTGFKGVWMSLMLAELGHKVIGISRDIEKGSLFDLIGPKIMEADLRLDIRKREDLISLVRQTKPEIIIHFAAQSLVRQGYRDPIDTYETNVLGTLNVLDAASYCDSVQAQLIVTTDKVYQNTENRRVFIEEDPLGGADPYSASKAMADILAQTWAKNNPHLTIAVARAGNVIGGGDINKDRLVPDLIGAFRQSVQPTLRNPNAIRPWQHVLDCLNGYWTLVEAMLENRISGAWNFGPEESSFMTVSDLASKIAVGWGAEKSWKVETERSYKESEFLALNSSKAKKILGWRNIIGADESIEITVEWYKQFWKGANPEHLTRNQILDFFVRAQLRAKL